MKTYGLLLLVLASLSLPQSVLANPMATALAKRSPAAQLRTLRRLDPKFRQAVNAATQPIGRGHLLATVGLATTLPAVGILAETIKQASLGIAGPSAVGAGTVMAVGLLAGAKHLLNRHRVERAKATLKVLPGYLETRRQAGLAVPNDQQQQAWRRELEKKSSTTW